LYFTPCFISPLCLLYFFFGRGCIIFFFDQKDDMKTKFLALFALVLLGLANVSLADDDDDDDAADDILGARHLASIKQVYKLAIYNYAEDAILTGVLPDVFNPNVTARVYDFAIMLQGPLTVAEYFYGLVPNRVTYESVPAVISRVDFNHFINNGQVAYTSINYVIALFPSLFVIQNSTQVGTWRFDEDDKIIEVDNWQPYNSVTTLAEFDVTSPAYQDPYFTQVCSRHMLYCTGPNQQYDTYDDCIAFMESLPFGAPDENEWSSTQCRWWHAYLSKLRPNFHCPHVGPTGGGVCDDFTVASLYNPFFPNDPNRLVGPASYVATIP